MTYFRGRASYDLLQRRSKSGLTSEAEQVRTYFRGGPSLELLPRLDKLGLTSEAEQVRTHFLDLTS